MVDFHRLNPNALLVLLGTVIYVVVGARGWSPGA